MSKASKKNITIKNKEIQELKKELEIIKDPKGNLTLTESPMTKQQLLFVLQRTPQEHVYERPAKGGGTWKYVTGTYVKKALNYVFGWRWDFQIIDKGREEDQIWVQGRLTIKDDEYRSIIIKEQFGRADIKLKKNTKLALDYGNDLKAAATDALKKCASDLGIASDIFGSEEFKEIRQDSVKARVEKKEEKQAPISDVVYLCAKCETEINEATYDYSLKLYGVALCREHQRGANKII